MQFFWNVTALKSKTNSRKVPERYDKGMEKMVKKRGAPLGNMNAVKFRFDIDYGYRLMMASIEEKLISKGRWNLV